MTVSRVDRTTVALIAYLCGSVCFIVGSLLMLYDKVKR